MHVYGRCGYQEPTAYSSDHVFAPVMPRASCKPHSPESQTLSFPPSRTTGLTTEASCVPACLSARLPATDHDLSFCADALGAVGAVRVGGCTACHGSLQMIGSRPRIVSFHVAQSGEGRSTSARQHEMTGGRWQGRTCRSTCRASGEKFWFPMRLSSEAS